jgi:hypothetical protein
VFQHQQSKLQLHLLLPPHKQLPFLLEQVQVHRSQIL